MNSVREISSLINDNGVRVSEFSIEAGTQGVCHFHSEVMEYCYCLRGELSVNVGKNQSQYILSPGEKIEIAAGLLHSVSNNSSNPSHYLVVQGVGQYDFIQES